MSRLREGPERDRWSVSISLGASANREESTTTDARPAVDEGDRGSADGELLLALRGCRRPAQDGSGD